MILMKKSFLILIFFLIALYGACKGQESYLIKKKAINENIIIKNNDESKNSKEPIPKNNKVVKPKNIPKTNKKTEDEGFTMIIICLCCLLAC